MLFDQDFARMEPVITLVVKAGMCTVNRARFFEAFPGMDGMDVPGVFEVRYVLSGGRLCCRVTVSMRAHARARLADTADRVRDDRDVQAGRRDDDDAMRCRAVRCDRDAGRERPQGAAAGRGHGRVDRGAGGHRREGHRVHPRVRPERVEPEGAAGEGRAGVAARCGAVRRVR